MKYTCFLFLLLLANICNAQTERFKEVLKDSNINASLENYQNELRTRNSNAYFKTLNESNGLVLNGRLYSGKEMNEKLSGLSFLSVSTLEITEDKKKISVFTTEPKIKKLILISTKQRTE